MDFEKQLSYRRQWGGTSFKGFLEPLINKEARGEIMEELNVSLCEIPWVLPEIIGIRVKRGGPAGVLHL